MDRHSQEVDINSDAELGSGDFALVISVSSQSQRRSRGANRDVAQNDDIILTKTTPFEFR